jgi:hypothetical protein
MRPEQVNPNAWSNHEVIYDDGEFSSVWGQFNGSRCLGTRWNGETDDERGYPGQGAYPLWFVVPPFLALSTLERLHTAAIQSNLANPQREPYAQKIQDAIRQFESSSP